MSAPHADAACVLNSGGGAWAFAGLAEGLGRALGVPVSDEPRAYNYVLGCDGPLSSGDSFVPWRGIQLAADKREQALAFRAAGVAVPETHLFDGLDEARAFVSARGDREWCLKFPTACGAVGHRLFPGDGPLPPRWPTPYLVQEFVRLARPEVYRTYAIGGELFGWVARRYAGESGSPWVAHARGARYAVETAEPPAQAAPIAAAALAAAGLLASFGCADLIRRPQTGQWLVLEVGTDGVYNHVDRDIGDPIFERELLRRLAAAFWRG